MLLCISDRSIYICVRFRYANSRSGAAGWMNVGRYLYVDYMQCILGSFEFLKILVIRFESSIKDARHVKYSGELYRVPLWGQEYRANVRYMCVCVSVFEENILAGKLIRYFLLFAIRHFYKRVVRLVLKSSKKYIKAG